MLTLLTLNAEICIVINPRHACAARVTVVCLPHSYVCVCLSVTTLAKPSLGYTQIKVHTALE